MKKNKKLINLLIPIISSSFGGGEIISFKIVKFLYESFSQRKHIYGDLRLYIFILLPCGSPLFKFLNDMINKLNKSNIILSVYIYCWKEQLDYLKKLIKLLADLVIIYIKKYRNKVILLSPICTAENLFFTVIFKLISSLIKTRTVIISIIHGNQSLLYYSFKVKRGIINKIYSLFQIALYFINDLLSSYILTIIPLASLTKHKFKKYILIPVPYNIYNENDEYIFSKRPVIFFMGRLYNDVKGDFDVIYVYTKVLIKLLAYKVKKDYLIPQLVICGEGPDKEHIKKLVEKINNKIKKIANEKILYMGFIRGNLKEQILRDAIICILPSRFESFPIVVSECIAYGAKVLTYKGPWIKNYNIIGVDHLINGVPLNDLNALTLRLEEEIINFNNKKMKLVKVKNVRAKLNKYYNEYLFRKTLMIIIHTIINLLR